MDQKTYDILAPDVKTAARTAGREWADVLEADDAEQEIWLLLLDRSDGLPGEIAALEQPARVSYLTEVAHQIGVQSRDDYELFSGNYLYGTRAVREMLDRDALGGIAGDVGVAIPTWEVPEALLEQLNRTDTETATERIDLGIGLKRLHKRNARYVAVIMAQFVDNQPIHDHSQELTRAVDALTHEMNRTHRARVANYTEGPGSRKAISNEQAQKITRNDLARNGSKGVQR